MTRTEEPPVPTASRRPVDADVICRWALTATISSDPSRLAYRPARRGVAEGLWDPAAVARGVALLLDEALAGTGPDGRVELSVRARASEVVLRIEDRRAYHAEDGLASLFDAWDDWPPERAAAARGWVRSAGDELRRQGATLTRSRTPLGTTSTIVLPRCKQLSAEPVAASGPELPRGLLAAPERGGPREPARRPPRLRLVPAPT